MTTVLCTGAAVLDFVFHMSEFPVGGQKFGTHEAEIHGGGNAANAAVAITRLGGNAVLAAALGEDVVAHSILDELKSEGVDISRVSQMAGAASSYSCIIIDKAGDRQIINFRGRGLKTETGWFPELEGISAVLSDTRRVNAATAALSYARGIGVPGVLDAEEPIDLSLLQLATHVAFSMQGLMSLAPNSSELETLASVAKEHGNWTCVTDGAMGVWWSDGGSPQHIPAIPVKAVDTLGAGDVWHGAFALELGRGRNEVDAIQVANVAAALKCTAGQGRSSYPRSSDVTKLLKETFV